MTRNMKDSGIEWIGEIPEDWKVIPLKNICKEFYSGGTPTASNNSYYTTTEFGYPFINISDLTNNKYVEIIGKHITIEAAKSKNLKLIDNNYVLLAMYASTGTVSMLKLRSYISQAILAIKPGIKIEKEYLFYFLSSFKPYSELYSRGTTQNNLNAEIIKNLKVPIPNIKMQLKITNFLNIKSNQIQKLMNKINKQIQTLEDYKKSLITEAVTKGLDKNVEMKDSEIEWIGEIPKHWKLVKGKYIFKQRNSRGNDIDLVLLSPSQKYGVIPQDLYEELSGMRAVKLDLNTNLNNLKTIHVGDFCISLRSFQGGFEYSNYEGVVSPAYQVFYSYIESCNDYYKYMFKERGFIEKMNSFTMSLRDGKNISFSDFANSYIPKPPIGEQQEIAKQLNKFVALTNNAIAAKQKQLEILEEYKKSLIYEYVTGKKEVEDVGTI